MRLRLADCTHTYTGSETCSHFVNELEWNFVYMYSMVYVAHITIIDIHNSCNKHNLKDEEEELSLSLSNFSLQQFAQ